MTNSGNCKQESQDASSSITCSRKKTTAMRFHFLLIAVVAVFATFVASHQAVAQGLSYTLGGQGLATLSYNGKNFLSTPSDGKFAWPTTLTRPDATTYFGTWDPISSTVDTTLNKVTATWAWGQIAATYKQRGDTLNIDVTVSNTTNSDTITNLTLTPGTLTFDSTPTVDVLDGGMWGTNTAHLYNNPLYVNAGSQPPAILVNFSGGSLVFCTQNPTDSNLLGMPSSANSPANTMFPFTFYMDGNVAPGTSRTAKVSLRFGAANAKVSDLADDIVKGWRAANPQVINWADRRPIGAMFLASNAPPIATNPRHWIMNGGNLDVTTPAGMEDFRQRLLAWADGAIVELTKNHAQGMVTWDPEGMQYDSATYIGDPRLVSQLAPEMEYKGSSNIATIDAYFKKFTDAGFKVGVCLRGQRVIYNNGVVAGQLDYDSKAIAETEINAKIQYAKNRWGCKLFYIDTTILGNSPIPSSVIRNLYAANPDILMMPENEECGYFGVSAPFNSFLHHGVTKVPTNVLEAYPKAFSAILLNASVESMTANRAALVDSARQGNVFIFNCWYSSPENDAMRSIYEEATTAPAGVGTGVNGTYFNKNNWTSQNMARVDPTIDFDWLSGAPVSSMPADNFSVRWTGQIQPLYSEVYTFTPSLDDIGKLWVNGQLVVNRTAWKATDDTGSIALTAGQKYDVRLDMRENTGNAKARLFWESSRQPKQIVPMAQLYPVTNALPTVSLTSPAASAVLQLNETMMLQATATDSVEGISRVEFYVGSTKIGEDESTPYAWPWTPTTAGTYVLKAQAYDKAGATKTSSTKTVTVR